jgi:hypothetical protein
VAQCEATGPQSAIAGQALAAEIAIQRLTSDPSHTELDTELVADCQAFIRALSRGPSDSSYKCKFAGHHKGANTARIVPVKVKAHLSEQAAKDLGCHQHWFGNDRADYWANDVRNTTGKAGADYVVQQRAAFNEVMQATARISSLPRVDTYPSRDTRKQVAKELAQHDPRDFV